LSANQFPAGADDELEAELRDLPPIDVPAGLEASLLAAIPARFGARTPPLPRRHRAALFLAAAACVPAAIAIRAVFTFESPRPSLFGRRAPGAESVPAAFNTHAEETRPCDVLPPLP
jgi:hypothetical protein